MVEPAPPRARRPRDRRSHITRAAVTQFAARGFHGVQLGEVAEAVGITAPAIYRHFPNKRALLTHVVLDGVEHAAAAVAVARASGGPPPVVLERVLYAVASGAVSDHHGVTTLWKRESRSLDAADRDRLRDILLAINADVAAAITARGGPAAPGSDADLRARAAIAALTSLSTHRVPEPAERAVALLCDMGHAAATAHLPSGAPVRTCPDTPSRAAHLSRREELLAAAARLFRERGYAGVSVADLGAAVRVTGPSVYAHFASKQEILAVLLARTTESLALATNAALAEAESPQDAVERLLRGYAGFALAHTDLLSVSLTEVAHLPEEARPDIHRARRDVVAEWIGAVRRLHPGIDATAARVRVYAAMSVINDLVQVRALRARGDLDACLTAVGRAVLTAPTDRRR
ncbi:MAG TPA: TetR/AcrR family transcriptional regulator [Streptosporangiaceae bacterium]